MQNRTFGFIGSGRVSYLLLSGLHRQAALPPKIWISDPDENALQKVTSIDPDRIQAVSENRIAAAAEVVFLAIHPPVLNEVASEIKNSLKPEALLVSILPTVTIRRLSQLLDGFDRIVRMIPNAPSIIGKGYNPICFSPSMEEADRLGLRVLFEHWGESPEVAEDKLEAYAILTGMGPTYFWFQWLELQRLAMAFGLSQSEAKLAIVDMLHGAVEVLFKSDLTEQQVFDLIPSYPLKKDEEEIRRIFIERLNTFYTRLVDVTS